VSGDSTIAETVLVADDDPDLVLLVARRLAKDGYQVITACDGEDALHQAQQCLPQLAVLDVMMPKLTGVEVMEQLRSDPATQAIQIVLITAGSFSSDADEGVPAGADGYAKKPFGRRELLDRVRAVLDAAPASR
jgi:two-component system alkaline phosphatase synthesis response regulator PhoP